MSDEKEYTLDKIKNINSFIESSNYYQTYEVFRKSCDKFVGDGHASCYTKTLGEIEDSSEVTSLLKDLYSNLFRLYASIPYTNNTYFDFNISEYEKICCISLKYWLYEQIIYKHFEETDINAIFTGWETYLRGKIPNKSTDLCIFNNLKKDEIKKLKKIYALYTVLYDNNAKFETCNNNTCKYLDYVGKGLDELISSINRCSSKVPKDNYCKEFDKFVNICKDESLNAGIIIYDESKKRGAKTSGKHLLYVQTYENTPHYIYIKNEELLNYVKTSDFLSNKSTTIAATSVVGSAIGLSSIFYYFYKFTPFGSSLRKGKGKNIVNMNEEAHNSLLYTSDTEQIPLTNREYKVAYHTLNNT